jgi:hypothetical protein
LLPGLITYFRGAFSSYLNLFFEICEYLARASFLAYKNFSYSCAAFSKGFGSFLGGKYLGFLTSCTGVSSSSSFKFDCFLVTSLTSFSLSLASVATAANGVASDAPLGAVPVASAFLVVALLANSLTLMFYLDLDLSMGLCRLLMPMLCLAFILAFCFSSNSTLEVVGSTPFGK